MVFVTRKPYLAYHVTGISQAAEVDLQKTDRVIITAKQIRRITLGGIIMAIDRTVKFTVRLNMLNPAHVTINKVLNELNLDIFKSKNQFFIDAATYYIENYGQEELTQLKKEKEPEFVSTEDMEAIEKRIRQAAKEEACQEANKEVMTMVGSLLAAIQAGGGAMSVMNKADAAMETGMKSISDEESEDYEEDETSVQSALRWMVND